MSATNGTSTRPTSASPGNDATRTAPSTSTARSSTSTSPPAETPDAARRFLAKAIKATGTEPDEVVTDGAKAYPGVLDALLPGAFHNTKKHANNKVETDHCRLKARLRPMRGLEQDRSRPDHHSGPCVWSAHASTMLPMDRVVVSGLTLIILRAHGLVERTPSQASNNTPTIDLASLRTTRTTHDQPSSNVPG